MAAAAFVPPPLSSHQPAEGFTPPPLSSHQGPAGAPPEPTGPSGFFTPANPALQPAANFFKAFYDEGIAPFWEIVKDARERGDLGEHTAQQILGAFKDQAWNFVQHPDWRNLPLVGPGITATANQMQRHYDQGDYAGMFGSLSAFAAQMATASPEVRAMITEALPELKGAFAGAGAEAAEALRSLPGDAADFAKAAAKGTAAGAKAAAPDLYKAAVGGGIASHFGSTLGDIAAAGQAGRGIYRGAKAFGEAYAGERAAQAAADAADAAAAARAARGPRVPIWQQAADDAAAAKAAQATEESAAPAETVPATQPLWDSARREAQAAETAQAAAAAGRATPEETAAGSVIDSRPDAREGLSAEAQSAADAQRAASHEETAHALPQAGAQVSGLEVGQKTPNRGSIDSSFENAEELPGVREVPMSWFGPEFRAQQGKAPYGFYAANDVARVENLAGQIEASGRIDPLVVAVDKDGPYILEGGHRVSALAKLGKESFPARIVIDRDSLPAAAEAAAAAPETDLEAQLRASIEQAQARRAGVPALTPAQALEDALDEHRAYLKAQGEDIKWANRARKADRIAQYLIESGKEATPENIAGADIALKAGDELIPGRRYKAPSDATTAMIQDRVEWHNARIQSESGQGTTAEAGSAAGETVDAGTTGARQPLYESARPGARSVRAAGDGTEVEVPGEDHTYPARYEVRELSEVQPSHNPHNFNENPQYEHVNDRNYDDPENQRKIIEWSQGRGFKPRNLLNTAPDSSSGPPVIDGRGNVLGGNGRTMILGRVYENNPAGAAAYRAELDRTAAHYGIDPESYAHMEQPVLVRRLADDAITTPEATQKAITDFNKIGTAALTPAERAIADARRVSVNTLEDISRRMDAIGPDATLAQALEGKSGGEVLSRLMDDGVISPQEGAQLRRGGQLTRVGQERISGLMLGRFFSSAQQLDSLPASLRNKMERLAAPLARVEGNADYSLSAPIRRALDLIEDAGAHDMTLDDFTRQSNFFSTHNYPPEVVTLAKNLESRDPVALTQAVRDYAGRAKYAEEYQGPGMFGDIPEPVRPGKAFNEAFGREALEREAKAKEAAKQAKAAKRAKQKTGTEDE